MADDQIKLTVLPPEEDWEPAELTVSASTTVASAVKQIASSLWNGLIKNPEAYGLCLPPDREQQHAKKKQLKKKLKVGAFRDETIWLDGNHSLAFYKFQNDDKVVFRVKLAYLSQSQTVTIIIPSLKDKKACKAEHPFTFDYHTTVDVALQEIISEHNLGDLPLSATPWKLLLPFGRKQNSNKLLGVWLSPERTLQSYAFYNRSDDEKKKKEHPRVLVCCRELAETKKVNVKIINADEYEHEMWWASQLDKNKWHAFQPKHDYSKYEKARSSRYSSTRSPYSSASFVN